ncbi:hypothetical protein Tco_0845901 [Tanacetum coccineum]
MANWFKLSSMVILVQVMLIESGKLDNLQCDLPFVRRCGGGDDEYSDGSRLWSPPQDLTTYPDRGDETVENRAHGVDDQAINNGEQTANSVPAHAANTVPATGGNEVTIVGIKVETQAEDTKEFPYLNDFDDEAGEDLYDSDMYSVSDGDGDYKGNFISNESTDYYSTDDEN